ncbi:MAG TPA: ribonuclease Z [Streptosporangiaceae bacterium]|nr:ribonuclease Z [Streptosporangiaceae bacterium]
MSGRELVVLGTASQAPTRRRNHNGYLLRWDGTGILFDPGEGTQRQMLFAGVTSSQINRICITHFHGDHCLGLPGVLQRMSLDRVPHPVHACYPAEGREVFAGLRHAALYHDVVDLREHSVAWEGTVADEPSFRLEARRLSHAVPAIGYRLVEPDGRRMLPDRLAAAGVEGADVSVLQREGTIQAGGRTVTLAEVSEHRPGQRVAFIMDTRLCDAAFDLAQGTDMVVCESTFADAEAGLAKEYGHLTAGQAGRIAAEAGTRLLVLTHFSQRYDGGDGELLAGQAAEVFGGTVIAAEDLTRITVPPRA